MPTLKEYILTLRTYNPGITDKTITLYLLKLGKKMEDIQAAFKELNPPVSNKPQTEAKPVVQEDIQNLHKDQASEIEIAPIEIAQNQNENPKEIHHQSFNNLASLKDTMEDMVDTQSGSSMKRKNFSYEELFGDQSSQKQSDVSQKDPTLSYVGGSIVKGEGSGAFAFKSSPVVNAHESSSQQPEIRPKAIVTPYPDSEVMANSTPMAVPPPKVDTKITVNNTHQPRSMIKIFAWIILVILILGGGAFAFMRYVYGVYLFVHPPFDSNQFVAEFVKSINSIDNAEYESEINFSSAEAQPEDEVFRSSKQSQDLTSTQVNLLDNMPIDTHITLHAEGLYQKDTDSKDGRLKMSGNYSGDGIRFEAEVESIKKKDTLYVRINSFPTIFFDLAKVKGKWISISPSELEPLFRGSGFIDRLDKDSNISLQKKMLVKIIEHLSNSGAVEVIGDPQKRVSADYYAQYVYNLTLNREKLIYFIETLPKALRTTFGDDFISDIDPELLASLKGEEFKSYFDYIQKNSHIEVTVDSKGNLVSINVTNKVTPSSKKAIKKTLTTNFTLQTKNINKNINVEAPQPIEMSFIDAYAILTGDSPKNILFKNQINVVESLDRAIGVYKSRTGSIPKSLDALRTPYNTLKTSQSISTTSIDVATSTDLMSKIMDNKPIYSGSIYDVYQSSLVPFEYHNISDSAYTLTYTIHLPPVPSSYYNMLRLLTIESGSIGSEKYNTGITTTNQKHTLTLRFVEGANTATESVLSKEAYATLTQDKDKDGLSDVLEAYLGLNPDKADTDSDGKSDLVELRQGMNPKGEGDWSAEYGQIEGGQ